ncbi:hypothetical protein [Staphylococcus aureus]
MSHTEIELKNELSGGGMYTPVSYTHLRAHETLSDLVCRLLLEKRHCLLYTSPSPRD